MRGEKKKKEATCGEHRGEERGSKNLWVMLPRQQGWLDPAREPAQVPAGCGVKTKATD